MKSHTLILKLILFLSLGIISCNQKEGITVGFLMESYSSARWAMDKKFFEEKVMELNGKVITKQSDGNEATQYAQALELIDEKVDVIVIVAVNVNAAAAIVREAHKSGIKVLAYDRLIRNSELDYYIGFDGSQIGQLQGQYALSKKPKGNYVLLEGDKSDINAVYFDKGQQIELAPEIEKGNINVLYHVFIDGWSPADAQYEMEKVIKLTKKPIDAVVAANDGTAGGAIKALKKYNIENVIVTGLDAELAACQRIYRGEQSMTVYTPIKELAQTAASLAMEIAQNKKTGFSFVTRDNGRKQVPSIILQSIILDKNNLNRIIEDGLYSKEDVFAK